MSFAIRVDNLSKNYRLGATHAGSIRELVGRGWNRLRGRSDAPLQSPQITPDAADRIDGQSFWALRDVSFEIQPGEVVGIIGRNGSGKSTLLKILSQITAPTKGRIELHGRVASLLEVGTGFHPELSGRENVFLNGAILGMTKPEIRRKFDEIVAFAEIEKFIDTPVKRYSSGMYVRLAFAVAAHLEPEILIVDEVLAVGDAGFQKKCLGKIGDVGRQGRTVLFVSHNMQAVADLTRRCIVLDRGGAILNGQTSEAIAAYCLSKEFVNTRGAVYAVDNRPRESNFVREARVITSHPNGVHFWGKPIGFEFVLQINKYQDSIGFSFNVMSPLGQRLCHFWLLDENAPFRQKNGRFLLRLQIPKFRLYMGSYTITTWLSDKRGDHLYEKLDEICPFQVTMLSETRPDYQWGIDECVYHEDGQWVAIEELKNG